MRCAKEGQSLTPNSESVSNVVNRGKLSHLLVTSVKHAQPTLNQFTTIQNAVLLPASMIRSKTGKGNAANVHQALSLTNTLTPIASNQAVAKEKFSSILKGRNVELALTLQELTFCIQNAYRIHVYTGLTTILRRWMVGVRSVLKAW